jgi:hypothetical protein
MQDLCDFISYTKSTSSFGMAMHVNDINNHNENFGNLIV